MKWLLFNAEAISYSMGNSQVILVKHKWLKKKAELHPFSVYQQQSSTIKMKKKEKKDVLSF